MKISNNALNFLLLAQYRAIFKRAYVKGLASAVLLTAGLAAGAAQAAPTDTYLDKDDFANTASGGQNVTITSNSELDMKDIESFEAGTGNVYIGTTTIDGATVDITGAAARHIITTNTLTVQNGGKLTVSNNNQTDTHIYGGADAMGATMKITGEGSSFTANAAGVNFAGITVEKGATVNLGGLVNLNYKGNEDDKAEWGFYTNLYANGSGNGTVTISDSTVNLNDQSMVGADKAISITGDSTINFDGSWHTLGKYTDTNNGNVKVQIPGDAYATAFLRGTNSSNGSVTISASRGDDNKIIATPELNVLDGRNGAIYANKIDINEAKVKIGSGSKFILDGDWVGKTLAQEGTHSSGTVTLKDVTFTNNGTLVLGNSQSGGRVNVTGKTDPCQYLGSRKRPPHYL